MLTLNEYDKNMLEIQYIMETYPVSFSFRDTGRHVAWSKDEGWCFYIDGEQEYILCDNFHHAMQKLVEPN